MVDFPATKGHQARQSMLADTEIIPAIGDSRKVIVLGILLERVKLTWRPEFREWQQNY
jgi:hypothetical protein